MATYTVTIWLSQGFIIARLNKSLCWTWS